MGRGNPELDEQDVKWDITLGLPACRQAGFVPLTSFGVLAMTNIKQSYFSMPWFFRLLPACHPERSEGSG